MYSDRGLAAPTLLSDAALALPLADAHVRAGFPSPAEDCGARTLDLTRELVTHPQATYLLRVRGDSMRDAGIADGDMLIVDKALAPRHGHIVVAEVDGQFTVKQLHMAEGRVALKAANPHYPDICPQEGQTLAIWGCVTFCIKRLSV